MKIRLAMMTLLVFGLTKFCIWQTEGFTINKMATYLLKEKPLPSCTKDAPFLKSSYSYLTKGGQSYVFISEDGQYVLKFLRSSRLHTLSFLAKLLPISLIKNKYTKEKNKLKKALKSYQIAYASLPQESGLLAVHLTQSQENWPPFILIDKLKIQHKIHSNDYPFIIQKRAVLVKERIKELMDQNTPHLAIQAIGDLFDLLQKKIALHITDTDANLTKNFGFAGDVPMQMDMGSLSLSEPFSLEKLQHSKEDLEHWINSTYPELSSHFNRLYENFLHEIL